MQRDAKNNRDKILIHGSNMWVDYTIGQKDGLFENQFFDEYSNYLLKKDSVKNALAEDYGNESEVNKSVLNESEIEFLSAEEYILPINDKKSNHIVGWVINKDKKIDENLTMSEVIKEAQLVGGKWNSKGQPLYNIKNVSSIHKYLSEEMRKSAREGKKSKRLERICKFV
jgi:hypothetical protein